MARLALSVFRTANRTASMAANTATMKAKMKQANLTTAIQTNDAGATLLL